MDQIACALDRTARAIDAAILRELNKRGIQLDPALARVLHGIGEAEVTASELTKRCYYTGSNAAYCRHQLRARGYITPCATRGARRHVLELTEKGQMVARIVGDLFVAHAGEAVSIGMHLPAYLLLLERLERFFNYPAA